MTDKKELILVSNPIEKDKKPPVGLLAYQKIKRSKAEPVSAGVNVLFMDDSGIGRTERRNEILNYFPDNSPEGAKAVETIINRTTGFSRKQLSSLLSHIRLNDFRNTTEFLHNLDEGVVKVWCEEV